MNDEILALDAFLREFIEQDDYATVVLRATPGDLAVPAKLLEARGRQGSEHVILLAVAACSSAAAWLDGLVMLIGQQLEAANAVRLEDGEEPWPALPLACLDRRQPPARRLRTAAEHLSRWLPEPMRIVWVLLPHTCEDRAGYVDVVASLCMGDPWMERHRFMTWDDREHGSLVADLERAKNPNVYILELDFSAPRQLDKLTSVVGDASRSPDVRMDALFQLAAVDFAYKRFPEALEKYGVLFRYYEGKDKIRQSMCLQGAGDVAMDARQPALALDRYRSGLVVAVTARAMPVMLPLLMGAGRACMALREFAEAAGYFEYANTTAGKLMNPYAKADALELRGAAERSQGQAPKLRAALASWDTCRKLCEQFAYEERWRSTLRLELELYERANMLVEAAGVRARLARGFETSGPGRAERAGASEAVG